MEEEIKITAQIDPQGLKCKFLVDRPIYPQGSIYFSSKEKAKGAPFTEKLFEIENVKAIQFAINELTVTTAQAIDWKVPAKKIAELIRVQIRSGEPAIPLEFKFASMPDGDTRKIVQEIFDNQINPTVAEHGGYVDLLDVKDHNIYLRMGGGCQGCGMADVTLRQGIEVAIRERIPDIANILDVTDHAGGTNPYYQPSEK